MYSSFEDDADFGASENWQDVMNLWALKPPKSIISVKSDSDATYVNQRLIKPFVFALVKAAAANGKLSLLLS